MVLIVMSLNLLLYVMFNWILGASSGVTLRLWYRFTVSVCF